MEKIFFPPPVVNMDISLVTIGACYKNKIAIFTHNEASSKTWTKRKESEYGMMIHQKSGSGQ
eukprot:3878907-Karenia_brevis.AAC.1